HAGSLANSATEGSESRLPNGSIIRRPPVVAEQPALAGRTSRHDLRVEPPGEVRRKLLGHHAPAVVDLEQVARLVGRDIIAAAVPDLAAEKQYVAGPAQHRL